MNTQPPEVRICGLLAKYNLNLGIGRVSDIMAQTADEFFDILTQYHLSSRPPIYPGAHTVIFHLTCILRKVSLRMLAVHTGWQANSRETESAKAYIEHWMKTNQPSARRCLWHAAAIYRHLREKANLECHEPLSLVIASLYIWAFDMLSDRTSQGDSSVTGSGPDGATTGSKGPVRIDRLNDERELNAWAESLRNDRIHLPGVGIPNGERSANRLMAEVQKVLSLRQPWSRLCRGLAYMVSLTVKERQVRSLEWKRNDLIPPETG